MCYYLFSAAVNGLVLLGAIGVAAACCFDYSTTAAIGVVSWLLLSVFWGRYLFKALEG